MTQDEDKKIDRYYNKIQKRLNEIGNELGVLLDKLKKDGAHPTAIESVDFLLVGIGHACLDIDQAVHPDHYKRDIYEE
jgi:hypothetical protein